MTFSKFLFNDPVEKLTKGMFSQFKALFFYSQKITSTRETFHQAVWIKKVN